MTRDPFYHQVVTRLTGRLDPELFEQCATDLLRGRYPGLVPVRGGGDAGMDGAVADGGGTAYPFVCTTGEDVTGNLRRSLKSYTDAGGTRRLVVSATSQALTPVRQRNLEAVAAELGFTLVAVHDQADFANLLYRDPRWCVELLNLPHDPPPLSALPRTVRPLPSGELIGRKEDLTWLRSTTGDILLVGEPGAGKTAIFADLARAGDGLFVVTDDAGRVMAGVREHQPPALLIDDAHLRADFLVELRRQRGDDRGGLPNRRRLLAGRGRRGRPRPADDRGLDPPPGAADAAGNPGGRQGVRDRRPGPPAPGTDRPVGREARPGSHPVRHLPARGDASFGRPRGRPRPGRAGHVRAAGRTRRGGRAGVLRGRRRRGDGGRGRGRVPRPTSL